MLRKKILNILKKSNSFMLKHSGSGKKNFLLTKKRVIKP